MQIVDADCWIKFRCILSLWNFSVPLKAVSGRPAYSPASKSIWNQACRSLIVRSVWGQFRIRGRVKLRRRHGAKWKWLALVVMGRCLSKTRIGWLVNIMVGCGIWSVGRKLVCPIGYPTVWLFTWWILFAFMLVVGVFMCFLLWVLLFICVVSACLLIFIVFVCVVYCVAPLAVSRPLPAASEPSKPSESKATLETDDYKAKKNKDCVRTGGD